MQFLKRSSFLISLGLMSILGHPLITCAQENTSYPLVHTTSSSIATFELSYIDPAHYIVGHQSVQYTGSSQEVTLDINHLRLPQGYCLDQVWNKYTIKYGETCEIEFQVTPQQAAISRSIEGLEGQGQTAITLNYVEAANPSRIVESQTIEQPNMPQGSYYAVFTLHQDYEINVPMGYQLSNDPPEVLQGLRLGRTDFYLEIEPNLPGVDPFYYGKGNGDGPLSEAIPLKESQDNKILESSMPTQHPRLEQDLESVTPVYLFYLDEMEQIIDSQAIYFPSQDYILLQEKDLHLPSGYTLSEPWEPYYTENGEPLTVSLVLTPLEEIPFQDFSSSLVHPSIEEEIPLEQSALKENRPIRQMAYDTAVFQNAFFYKLMAIGSLFGFLGLKRLLI